MAESSILSVISIVVSRLKHSTDSLKVFRSALNLSVASTASKNYLNDKLLVELNYRYVRDRTRFVIKKLEYFIINNNFDKFKQFADLVMDQFSTLEGVRLITYRLLLVVERVSSTFLSSYLDYFDGYPYQIFLDRKALKQTLVYPQIRPNLMVNAIKMIRKNNWDDKLRVLFRYLWRCWKVDQKIGEREIEAISNQQHLNMTKLAFHMKIHYNEAVQGRYQYVSWRMQEVIESLLKSPAPIKNAIKMTRNCAQLPIEEQPWFFGNVSREFISRALSKYPRNSVWLVAFTGSRLFCYKTNRKRFLHNGRSVTSLTPYAISNNGVVKDFELYQFFRSVVASDLERTKHLQSLHKFNWSKISSLDINAKANIVPRTFGSSNQTAHSTAIKIVHQPHPLNEYLNVVDDIHEDIVDWLFELCPLNRISFDWERKDMPDSHFNIVKKIIERGGQISSNLWIQCITKSMPTKRSELVMFADAWDDVDRTTAWQFVLRHYHGLSKKQPKVISETKMTVLLAWKHADGESIGFRNLPKELIREIVGYLDEPPFALVFARIFAERCKKSSQSLSYVRFDNRSWLVDNTWAFEFLATEDGFHWIAPDLILNFINHNWKYSTIRSCKDSILKFINRHNLHERMSHKLMKCMFKYVTGPSLLTPVWQTWIRNVSSERFVSLARILVIEALKTRNSLSLCTLLSFKRYNIVPEKELFEEKIKPKHDLTYEDALKLIDEIEHEDQ